MTWRHAPPSPKKGPENFDLGNQFSKENWSRGGLFFHRKMVQADQIPWRNSPVVENGLLLENRFPVICMIYKVSNVEDGF